MENSAYLALPLFAGLAAGDIPAALAALDALCRPFAKGETLLEAGQRGAPMGVVLAGRVLIEHLDLWGNRTLLSEETHTVRFTVGSTGGICGFDRITFVPVEE